jgi:hypothetical protein
MSSVPNLLARIQCLEAYTSELEEGQRQIFRFLGRWVDEADQSVSLLRFFLVRDCFIETSVSFEG